MNIQDLPSEILEKILIEGNYFAVSRVCWTWYNLILKKKKKLNKKFFILKKIAPEKINKKNSNIFFF